MAHYATKDRRISFTLIPEDKCAKLNDTLISADIGTCYILEEL